MPGIIGPIFSSIGTAIGIAGAIFLGDSWRILDPIAGVMVSFYFEGSLGYCKTQHKRTA